MKGQFYSLIAILVAVPIFMFTINYLSYTDSLGDMVSDRVISDQISQLVSSIELDTEKAIQIAGRRALLAATNEVLNSGKPLKNAVANLTTLMLTGTINNTEAFLMIDNTIPDWSERISSKSTSFDLELQYGNISVENNDGFSIRVGVDINISVTDKLERVKIEKFNERKYVDITVNGLEDPMFLLNTQGFIRRIIRTPEPSHVAMNVVTGGSYSGGSCAGEVTFNKSEVDNTKILVAENITGVVYARHLGIILADNDNLTSQVACSVTGNSSAVALVQAAIASGATEIYIDDSTQTAWSIPLETNIAERYYYRGAGPNFLQRLEGGNDTSPDGMFTFIYTPELEEQAFPVFDYSRVAYRYFAGEGDCYQVNNMPEWFGIDSADSDALNLTELLTATPCVVS
ncbi:MAG: hypothetical protein JW789_05325 [Candidatus Aenigmarchaeota archaeon]|nr:hypothetical protein [Candidatus Aenigmarchaeota archaeon]